MRTKQVILFALVYAACLTTGFSAAKPPNIILMYTDDQGYGDACYWNDLTRIKPDEYKKCTEK